MYKMIILVVCVFLAFRLGTSLQHTKRAPVKFDGAQVEFPLTDNYRMVAGVGGDISGEYLVVGGAPVNEDQMGHLAVLPMAVANKFKEKYGDYRKCNNAGADEAKASVINMSLIMEDQKTKDDLKQIVAQEREGYDLVVALEGSRLDLIKYYYRDEKEPQDAEHFVTNNEFYLIRSMAIISSTK